MVDRAAHCSLLQHGIKYLHLCQHGYQEQTLHLYQHTAVLCIQSLGIQYTPVSTGYDSDAMLESLVQLL